MARVSERSHRIPYSVLLNHGTAWRSRQTVQICTWLSIAGGMAIDGKKTNTEPSCDRVTREIVGEAVEKFVKEIKKRDRTQVKGDYDTGDDEDFI